MQENPVFSLEELRSVFPDRETAYEWLTSPPQHSVEELTKIIKSLDTHFPGTELIPDSLMQTVYIIVDGELRRQENATQNKE